MIEHFKEKCREHGLKITPQRTVIYQELIRSQDHPNSDLVFKKVRRIFPNISFDTVNRTLLTFSQIGIVDVVEGYGGPKRFDPNVGTHHHFHCLECGEIIDIYEKAFDRLEVPGHLTEHFMVFNKKVILEGICNACNQEKTNESTRR